MRYKYKAILLILALLAMMACTWVARTGMGRTGDTLASTPTFTPAPSFSATVEVLPGKTHLYVNESLQVRVSVIPSEGCQFPIYELTLGQDVPLFEYISPPTTTVRAPGNPFTYTLLAVYTGTVTFDALAYGERYCGDYWQWQYLRGQSEPISVGP